MSNTILMFLEKGGGKLKNSALELAAAAKRLALSMNASIEAVVIDNSLPEDIHRITGYGVEKVYHITSNEFEFYNVNTYAPALQQLTDQIKPTVLLGVSSVTGKDSFPKVSAALGVTMVSEVTGLEYDNNLLYVTRPVYSGKAFMKLKFVGKPPYIITLKPNSFGLPREDSLEQQNLSREDLIIENIAYVSQKAPLSKTIAVIEGNTKEADLTEAEIIVAGGGALKSPDNFSVLYEIAKKLGGIVGASRVAVDSGLATQDMQIGQTGKTVGPKLYLAFGISGAIQHLAGINSSKVIVAVNKDPNAPIFKMANYGIIGDLFETASELNTALDKTSS